MVAAAASKRLRNSMLSRTCCTKAAGILKVLGWPSTRNLVLGVQVLAIGAAAVGSPTSPFAFYKGARKHFAKPSETAQKAATQAEIGIRSRRHKKISTPILDRSFASRAATLTDMYV